MYRMRMAIAKKLHSGVLVLALAGASAAVSAKTEYIPTESESGAEELVVTEETEPAATAVGQTPALAATPRHGTARAATAAVTRAARSSGRGVKSLASVADLAGDYIMTYASVDTTLYDGGSMVTLTAVAGTDSIRIADILTDGTSIAALVDLASMTVTIPSQLMGYDDTYGYFDFAACGSDGSPDRSTPVTGTIADDGKITLNSAWGAYVNSGSFADEWFGIYDNTIIEKANATLTCDVYISKGDSVQTRVFNVAVEQTASNKIEVRNFCNYGSTVVITLRSDSTATIEQQYLYTNVYGDWYSYSASYTSSYTVASWSNTITCYQAADARTVSWGPWLPMHPSSGFYIYASNVPLNGKLETTFDLSYPTYDALSLTGSGTAESPYLVASVDDWSTLATYIADSGDDMTGQYVKLTADLDFDGATIKPLGYDRTAFFNGDLDGGGHTITGFVYQADAKYSGALAPVTGDSACIHDITLDGTVTNSGNLYTGGVVGHFCGKMMYNVTNKSSYTGTGSQCGGFVGMAEDGSVFLNCVNEGSVTSSKAYTGGFAGFCGQGCYFESCGNRGDVTYTGTNAACYAGGFIGLGEGATLIDCFNEGNVSAQYSTVGYMAGLFSYVRGNSADEPFTFKGCRNSGSVTGYSNVGGLICYGNSSAACVMDSCYNTGDITATYTGVSGKSTGGLSAVYFKGSTYRDCWNSGNVTSYGTYYLGGLFGRRFSDATADLPVTITGCHNSGAVTGGSYYVGGIVGYITQHVNIDSCYNTGDVTGASEAIGGIAGYTEGYGTSPITSSWNSGAVEAGDSYAGGLIGYGASTNDVTRCFNVGPVTAGASCAGGLAGYSPAAFTDVYNAGDVTAADYVGGLIGLATADSTTIATAYSTGKITATSDTARRANTVASAASGVTGAYYLAANAIDGQDTIGEALSRAQLAALELDGWTSGDSCTYPILCDADHAKVHAAAIITAEGDTYDNVTQDFSVGAPDGLTWAASTDKLTIDGNKATFTGSFHGTLTLTATCGQATATTELTCLVGEDRVAQTASDTGRVAVARKHYTTSGVEVAAPGDNQIYIVVTTYDDGSSAASKQAM